MSEDRIEIEASGGVFKVPPDRRPHLEEPLPVNLIAVADVRALAPTGLEKALTDFYVKLWEFQRDESYDGLAFRADNFRLIFDLREGPIERPDLRPIGIEIRSLPSAEHKLIDAEIDYQRQRGVQPGTESLLLQDPAGNWIELTERREL